MGLLDLKGRKLERYSRPAVKAVEGLVSTELRTEQRGLGIPGHIPGKASKAIIAGVAFEDKVAAMVENESAFDEMKLYREPRIVYEDSTGVRKTFPDFVLCGDDRVIVIEVKLSGDSYAMQKLLVHYTPIIEDLFGKPVQVCLVATRVVGDLVAETIDCFADLLDDFGPKLMLVGE